MGFDAGSAWPLNRNISQLPLVNQISIVMTLNISLSLLPLAADVYLFTWLVCLLVG